MITNNSINNNTLTLIESQTVSLVTSVTFTSGITANNINYLMLSNDVTSAGTGFTILGQISVDGGSTYISSDYVNSVSTTDGLVVVEFSSLDATLVMNSECILFNFGTAAGLPTSISTTNGWSVISGIQDNGGNAVYTIASTTVNAFQLVMDDASVFSGTFSLYSYA